MGSGPQGTFVISWSQTEVDGLSGAPISAVDEGAIWIWRGKPVQIDCALAGPKGLAERRETYRQRAAVSARRIVSRALARGGVRIPLDEDQMAFDRTFTVTDGQHSWVATLIDMPEIARPLLMFAGHLPPEGRPLFVDYGISDPILPHRMIEGSEGVVCFTPGTRLETPKGLRAVEELVAGDQVITKDNGAQPVLWVGSRNVSGARLYAMPDLRPVRIREGALGGRASGDLIVSPDHRMLVQGRAARDLWGADEVLVTARDLVDDHGVARDMNAKSVTYVHLMLERHEVLLANGMETESFHPAAARLDGLGEDQRQRLYDVMPDLSYDPHTYGPMSRRALTQAEAALMPRVA